MPLTTLPLEHLRVRAPSAPQTAEVYADDEALHEFITSGLPVVLSGVRDVITADVVLDDEQHGLQKELNTRQHPVSAQAALAALTVNAEDQSFPLGHVMLRPDPRLDVLLKRVAVEVGYLARQPDHRVLTTADAVQQYPLPEVDYSNTSTMNDTDDLIARDANIRIRQGLLTGVVKPLIMTCSDEDCRYPISSDTLAILGTLSNLGAPYVVVIKEPCETCR